jgi:cell division protein FtsQ
VSRDVGLWRRAVVAVCFLIAAGVAYAVYALRVEEIRVTGLRTLDPRTVVEASGLHGGERILWIRLSAVTRRVERIPAVADVTVDRSLLQTVVIHVRERSPLARLDKKPELAVDAEGRQFRAPSATRLPTLEGWRGNPRSGASVDAASKLVLHSYDAFPGVLRTRVARIVIGPPMALWLADGTEIRFGALIDLEAKARVATVVLQREQGHPLDYVDVRAPAVPVSRRRAPPTPVPTPVPTRQAAPTTRTTPVATRAATPAVTRAPTPAPAASGL